MPGLRKKLQHRVTDVDGSYAPLAFLLSQSAPADLDPDLSTRNWRVSPMQRTTCIKPDTDTRSIDQIRASTATYLRKFVLQSKNFSGRQEKKTVGSDFFLPTKSFCLGNQKQCSGCAKKDRGQVCKEFVFLQSNFISWIDQFRTSGSEVESNGNLGRLLCGVACTKPSQAHLTGFRTKIANQGHQAASQPAQPPYQEKIVEILTS
ncbi:hypothetical protein B0H16DRAFT_1461524 [Mycena metata]|uniref:Uncharacterized protein n=1 Tax=Mycena metata TaxID=1033252 RepID=A0AAD7IQW4_9AGAR|nr:hypothetical protein B0H16DRAFT_1461524 [Mycena metata]